MDDDTRIVLLSEERARRRGCTFPFCVGVDIIVITNEKVVSQGVGWGDQKCKMYTYSEKLLESFDVPVPGKRKTNSEQGEA